MSSSIVQLGGRGGNPLTPPDVAAGANTAFGEKLVAELNPAALVSFPYGPLECNAVSGVMGSGTIAALSGMAVISTGPSTASSGTIHTLRRMQYIPGEGGLIRLTCRFDEPAEGCQQLIGYGDDLDGFFFGYDGLNFGVMKRRAGVDEWIYQDQWNKNKFPNLDWQKLNIFQIKFQWLGVGAIQFGIENPTTQLLDNCHIWEYANRNLVPSILNPSLPAIASIENTTNDTNKSMHVICLAAYTEGRKKQLNHLHSVSNTKTGITTLTNVLAIRNKLVFKGVRNRSMASIRLFNAAVEGNKPALVRILDGPDIALGGTPNWQDTHNHSMIEYDIAGTTVANYEEMLSMALGKSGNDRVPFGVDEIILAPGEILVIAAESALSTDVSVSVTWHEDL